MTNFISFDFERLNEIHPQVILHTYLKKYTKCIFPEELYEIVCDYLFPKERIKRKTIKIFYKTYDSHMTYYMPFYDFSFQLSRFLWFKYTLSRETKIILPNTKHDALWLKRNTLFNRLYKPSFTYLQHHYVEWFLLCIEIISDYIEDDIYYCVPWKVESFINRKYLNLLDNNMSLI